ncbi:MAG: hypothetical protein KIT02_13375 [Devosia sp.]|uniref:hypothetical protein n=1 Tax=Devosia sp. TaxID=1871048 RepID=UPI0024C72DDF|nr:hypothetical protein [Devosia sp.]UYN98914.1 MAG: hypothetical protein KIT02_13375 [Devosia sp.]
MPIRNTLAAVAILCLAPLLPALAQEVSLGDGSTATIEDYVIETDQEGRNILVIRAVPNFDPEPYGPVPSDDYARVMEQFCENVVGNSWAEIEAEDIGGVRVRWDFTPSQRDPELEASGITMTRFYEAVFEIRRDRTCLAMPLGVGLTDLAPPTPSGAPVKLEYIERGADPGDLRLTYRYNDDLLGADPDALERSAIELCILHADLVLETRAQYYAQLDSRSVTIAFSRPQGPGQTTVREVRFAVRNGKCATGLSAPLAQAILDFAYGQAAAD